MKQYDIVALGETLIDFVMQKSPDESKLRLEGNPGGAPANVLAGIAKLGLRTAFISQLGQDSFGSFLMNALSTAGIDTQGVRQTPEYPTTLAFVTLDKDGDRSFQFYRNQTADAMMEEHQLDFDKIAGARLFHFGAVSMSVEPACSTTLAAAAYARQHGVPVSYDPNLRVLLWKDLQLARQKILEGMQLADYVKLSEEELLFLTEEDDLAAGAAKLAKQYPVKLLVVTMGAGGSMVYCGGDAISASSYAVNCIDATGAGDAFWSAVLYCLLTWQKPVEHFVQADYLELLRFANAAGALATTKLGAIPAMPSKEEILDCMLHVSQKA